MLILKTSKETLPQVIKYAKHALTARPKFKPGEVILISETRDRLALGDMPIRYRMEIRSVYEDRDGESERIWGRRWDYIVEGYNCCALENPFDIIEVQVTRRTISKGEPSSMWTPEMQRQSCSEAT